MHVLITHAAPAVPVSLDLRINDLDQLVAKRHQEAAILQNQIDALQRRQGELDQEAEEAFNLRNDIAQGLGRDDVYGDIVSLLEACGQHPC